MNADVAVVGGGVMGLSTALRLAQGGASVIVLDPGPMAGEASSAAAGILGPRLEAEGPGPLLELMLASRAMWPAFAAELGEVDFAICGAVEVALDPPALAKLDARAAALGARRLDAVELRHLVPALGRRAQGGLHHPDEGRVDPRRVARALVAACERAGVRLCAGKAVRAIRVDAGRATGVDLDGERIAAPRVVLAAGSWSAIVPGGALPAGVVVPVRGQMAALLPREPVLACVLAVHGQGYLVPRAGGRVVAGSTMERVGHQKAVTAAGMVHVLSLAQELVPALGQAPVVETWSGLRPGTEDGLPILGETAVEGLFACTGHGRNGILLAPMSAAITAALVLGGRPPLDPAPFRAQRYDLARRTA